MVVQFRNILHADHHAIVCLGLQGLLKGLLPSANIEYLTNTTTLCNNLENLQADLLIFECNLPQQTCLPLIKTILNRFPKLPILLYTQHSHGPFLARMIRAGVQAVILKSDTYDKVKTAIHALAQGDCYYSPAAVTKICALEPKSAEY